MKSYSCLKMIPPFHPFSEALMSNLASRSFAWDFWEIQEILFHSKKSKIEFCVCFILKEKGQKRLSYYAQASESPTQFFLKRSQNLKAKNARLAKKIESAKVLAKRAKNSKGEFKEKNPELFLDFQAARKL